MRFLVLLTCQVLGIALVMGNALVLGLGIWVSATVAVLFLPPEPVDDND